MGIMLVSDSPTPVLDFSQLEVAFRASAVHDRPLALRCLERLLLREMDEARRVELLLEGVRVALPRRVKPDASATESGSGSGTDSESSAPASNDEGPRPSLALAMRYADAAIERAPLSSAAILAKAEVLEAAGRTEELQPLVSGFLARLEAERASRSDAESTGAGRGEPDLDLAARVTLLIRLASLQDELAPAEAAASLEDAARLTAKMRKPSLSDFGLAQRKQLAQLYERLHEAGKVTSEHKVASNHRGLLQLDPVYLPSLRALARRSREHKHYQRARALYSIISLLEPDSSSAEGEDARAFLAAHVEVAGPEPQELDLPAVTGELPNDGGLPSALAQLWEAGQGLLGDVFGRLEFDAKARVSPVGEGVLAQAWREVLRRLGQTKVALVADPTLDDRERSSDDPTFDWVEPRCQLPPILIAGKRAREAGEDQRRMLEFMLARGLYCARSEIVMFAGLERSKLAAISSAVLLALHPRHAQRKQNTRAANDAVSKLGHELGRKLPIRVARQITTDFTEHQAERFDARALRVWVRRAADRVGLLVCGDLQVAIAALAAAGPEQMRDRPLAERVAADPDLHALLGFVASGAYADRRRQLGWMIEGEESPTAAASATASPSGASPSGTASPSSPPSHPSPPISVELSRADLRVPPPRSVVPPEPAPSKPPPPKPAAKPIVTSTPVSRPAAAPTPIARPTTPPPSFGASSPKPAVPETRSVAPAATGNDDLAEIDDMSELDELALDDALAEVGELDVDELDDATVPSLPPPATAGPAGPPARAPVPPDPDTATQFDELDDVDLGTDESLDAVDLDDVDLD
jgi:hypothetical protein